ncbi:MAG: hypothetical protein OJF47_000853 [Nitrospira sp.]|jgi:hypothetical protein|nr:MAG: hypothetical protein OJF47_000853 [Nitrospira sp.]
MASEWISPGNCMEPAMRTPDRVQKVSWRNVTARVLAAAFGGYGLTYAATACLTLLLPLSKIEAILTASMLSFVFYTVAILWAFAASTPQRAWIGLLVPAAACAAVAVPLARTAGG